MKSKHHHSVAIGTSLLCGALILFATRRGPVLSPDSISYLSTAQHVRSGNGLTDFSGRPLTVFGPILPLLLAAGGRSLLWARIVGASAVAGASWLMFVLLYRRVRPWAAVVAAASFGVSQGLVRVGSTVWSETPYILIVVGVLAVLAIEPLTERRVAIGGLLCGLGFLTRYAGAGLVITGAVVVAIASLTLERRRAVRLLAIHLGVAAATCATWLVRNVIETGETFGPRFSGGATDSLQALVRAPAIAIGELVLGDRATDSHKVRGGVVILVLLAIAAIIAMVKRPTNVLDIGMIVFGLTSVIIPVVARRVTASDIEFRVMSPMMIPIVYTTAVALDRLRFKPVALVVCAGLASWWAFEGVAMANRTPQIVAIGAGSRTQFSSQLHDLIDALPADANVLTNSPQRVWWQNHRDPTLFAFTRPRAGNSNYPLSPADTLGYACQPGTYLAWFGQVAGGDDSPSERRPDLVEIVDLTLQHSVPGGALYRLSARDPTRCPH